MAIENLVTGIQHIGIPTGDYEKTVSFFKSLGFKEAYTRVNEQKQKMAFLKLKNIIIETYERDDTAMEPGAIDHIAIDVSDIEAAYDEVRKLGYTAVEDGIKELPLWEHGVRWFTIVGPNKEKVEFNQMLRR